MIILNEMAGSEQASSMQMHAYQQHTAMTRAVLWLIGLKFKNLES